MNHQNAVELVERAVRAEPNCVACASHTVVTADDSGLWLACAASGRNRSRLRPLDALGVLRSHTRRHLLDADAIEPAA